MVKPELNWLYLSEWKTRWSYMMKFMKWRAILSWSGSNASTLLPTEENQPPFTFWRFNNVIENSITNPTIGGATSNSLRFVRYEGNKFAYVWPQNRYAVSDFPIRRIGPKIFQKPYFKAQIRRIDLYAVSGYPIRRIGPRMTQKSYFSPKMCSLLHGIINTAYGLHQYAVSTLILASI